MVTSPIFLENLLGELHTGDLARIDGDQLVSLGRKKDMFIRGGRTSIGTR